MSRKLVLAALVAVMALGVSIAQATPSRIETLGGQGMYLQDDTNIFGNPATLGYYRNCVLLHLGGVDGGDMHALGGYSAGIGDMLTLGLIYGRNPSYELGGIALPLNGAVSGWTFDNNWGDYTTHAITYPIALPGLAFANTGAQVWENPIDIILAAKLGNLLLGVSWYMVSGKEHNTWDNDNPGDTEYTLKSSLNALKVGISADLGNIMPEVWFHYVPYKVNSKWENTAPVPATEYERELKGRRFNLGGRAFLKMGDNLTIVPAVEWSNVTGNVSVDSTPDEIIYVPTNLNEEDLSEEYKGNLINAGVSLNWTADRVLLVTSFGLQYAKYVRTLEVDGLTGDRQDSLKMFALPVVGIGLEYQATKILVVRGGISTTTIYAKGTENFETDLAGSLNPEEETAETYQSTTAAVGIGLHFGNLIIDLTAGDMIIDNEQSQDSLFSALDMKLKFD